MQCFIDGDYSGFGIFTLLYTIIQQRFAEKRLNSCLAFCELPSKIWVFTVMEDYHVDYFLSILYGAPSFYSRRKC